jgi:hypothetical protein
MVRRCVAVRGVACAAGLALASGAAWPADELAPIRQLIPAGARVLFHVQANVDDTPGKEWLIQYKLAPPGEYDTWPAGYIHLLILRQRDGEWRKVLSRDVLDDLELRDLDGDRVLEVIEWCHDEGYWGFVVLDFRDGRFRIRPGLDFGYPASDLQGSIDLEGDGPLEMVATGLLPGYLAAMAPDLLLTLSRSGNHEAKRPLLEMTGEAVDQELVRSLTEDPPPPYASPWGDLHYVDCETGYVPGWLTRVAGRLGEKATPVLMGRVERTLPLRTSSGRQQAKATTRRPSPPRICCASGASSRPSRCCGR